MFPTDELRDVKPPVDLPANPLFWLVPLALLAGLAAFFACRWFIQNKSRLMPKPEAPTPWALARGRLEELHRKGLPGKGQVNAYYTELSNIIRRYIEERFSIRAPEMTTEEFLASLGDSQDLSSDQKQSLARFMEQSDEVKFAKGKPSSEQMEESFSLARKFIEETAS